MKSILIGIFILCSGVYAQEKLGSIHDVNLKWTSDAKKELKFVDFKGKKVVMAMMYTTCHGACPMIFQKLNKIQEKLDASKTKADFVLITFDPKHDTAEAMAEFRKRTGVTKSNWTFLTGKDDDIRKLSMLLSVRYSKNPDSGEIMHDNKIFLISEDGAMLKTINGLEADISTLF